MALIITVATQKRRSSVIMALLYFLFVCCGVVLVLDVVCGSINKVVKAIGQSDDTRPFREITRMAISTDLRSFSFVNFVQISFR